MSDNDAAKAREARRAMRSIRHVRQHQHEWFPAPVLEYLRERAESVVWIGFQESLDTDFEILKRALRLPADTALPAEAAAAHRTPEGFSISLSETGRRNLAAWYAEDVRFVEGLRALRSVR